MRFVSEVMINRSREDVIKLFDSPDNMKQWMDGLQSFEHLDGIPGQVGAKSKLTFQVKQRRMIMIETIVKRDLPDEFAGTYDTDGVINFVSNKFIAQSDGTTRYITENEFQFRGIMKVLS